MPKPERRPVPEILRSFLLEHFRSISGALLLVLMGLSVQMGLQWLQDPWRFPLEVVKIEGDFRYLDKARLQGVVESHLDGGFFSADVGMICQAIEAMRSELATRSSCRGWRPESDPRPMTDARQLSRFASIARWKTPVCAGFNGAGIVLFPSLRRRSASGSRCRGRFRLPCCPRPLP